MKNLIKFLVIVVVVVAVGYYAVNFMNKGANTPATGDGMENGVESPGSDHTPPDDANKAEEAIGKSVQGRDIVAYHFGTGEDEILFVGGIHGGYSWNTALVALELVDFLKQNPNVIPSNVKVTVIPVLNPDGLYKVTGTTGRFTSADVSKSSDVVVSGRFNANTVDINRNFDCEWNTKATWQDKTISAGGSAFSEPESQAIRSYYEKSKPKAVVAWYSAAGGVYSSSCGGGVLAETDAINAVFAKASGYKGYEEFDFYEITGDMVNWFAKMKVPAISVLLTNHSDTEWSKNRAGVEALLKHYAK